MVSVNNVLEHVSLDEDLVDHCLTMKKNHSAAKKMCCVSKYEEDKLHHYSTSTEIQS